MFLEWLLYVAQVYRTKTPGKYLILVIALYNQAYQERKRKLNYE